MAHHYDVILVDISAKRSLRPRATAPERLRAGQQVSSGLQQLGRSHRKVIIALSRSAAWSRAKGSGASLPPTMASPGSPGSPRQDATWSCCVQGGPGRAAVQRVLDVVKTRTGSQDGI